MLTVNVEKRATIDECLEHPWISRKLPSLTDSTDGLTSAIGQLDFSKRKLARERTLLSALNDVKVMKVININEDKLPVKVWEKTPKPTSNGANQAKPSAPEKEEAPAAQRDPKEFLEMGGKGDEPLFGNDGNSRYIVDDDLAKKAQS